MKNSNLILGILLTILLGMSSGLFALGNRFDIDENNHSTSGDSSITPANYGLQQNYPNPFNPSTSISFTFAEDNDVELIIYNVKGEKIKTIYNGHVYANEHNSVVWNGKDADGKQVASGVYFYKLKAGTTEYRKKMIMVK